MDGFSHRSVLLGECIEGLNIKPGGIYVDGTAGGGGHSKEIAKRLKTGRLIAIDRDLDALAAAGGVLSEFGSRAMVVQGNFCDMKSILKDLGIEKADGILLDLGVSSYQLDTPDRGFSYNYDAPLDMRMAAYKGETAADLVNGYSEEELKNIIWKYGEERFSGRIASAIVRTREKGRIETTLQLAEIIKNAIPAAARREGPHPAKRTFQAIRIAVNDELGSLERLLADLPGLLNTGGRAAIITFHSLEDRIVKSAFSEMSKGCICPPSFPVCVCGKTPIVKVIGRKGVLPSKHEIEENPRSRSARLRIAEKL
jgi:16S rRNA (cytosine1402-N4)-methyltransferase